MGQYESSSVPSGTVDAGLLLVRVFTGLVFFMHGYQKLFDNGLSATQAGFDGMGVPMPELSATIVTFLELIGGAALILGIATRLIAIPLVIDMVGAYWIAHKDAGFFAMNGGFELVLLLGGMAAALALTGPGALSVDAATGMFGRMSASLTPRRA